MTVRGPDGERVARAPGGREWSEPGDDFAGDVGGGGGRVDMAVTQFLFIEQEPVGKRTRTTMHHRDRHASSEPAADLARQRLSRHANMLTPPARARAAQAPAAWRLSRVFRRSV
ncbi:hypothetical protein GCM10010270_85720 [Streptomyces violaceus]|nr:hypothetical protein GCM10010270_85720 [Streptomyces janthinus]